MVSAAVEGVRVGLSLADLGRAARVQSFGELQLLLVCIGARRKLAWVLAGNGA